MEEVGDECLSKLQLLRNYSKLLPQRESCRDLLWESCSMLLTASPVNTTARTRTDQPLRKKSGKEG